MADTPEIQAQNQEQAQIQPTPTSEPIPVQPTVATPENQSVSAAQPTVNIPVAQPVAYSTTEPSSTPVVQQTPIVQSTPVVQSNSNIQPQPTQTNDVNTTSEKQKRPVWLMASLGFITILCGIVTICAPSIFWKFMDIILGIFLVLSGISWIFNAFKNEQKYVGCLILLGVIAVILGFLLIFSGSELIGTLTIWAFALWALLRGCVLIYYSLSNKEEQRFWRGILTLGILLIILFIVIAFSDKGDARTLAGICIGISTVFDGLCLLVLSFRINNDPSLQDKMLEQANQNEIAQGSIDTSNITNSTTQTNIAGGIQQPATIQQPTGEVQPGTIQQPIVAQPIPVAVPTTEVQAPNTEVQTTVSTPVEQPTQTTEPIPVSVPTPEVQQSTEVQTQEAVQTPTEENKPVETQPEETVQAPVTESVPVIQPTPEAQQPTETQHPIEVQTEESVQTPVVENKPVEEVQAPVTEPAPEVQQPLETQPEETVQAPTEESKSEDKTSV